MTGVQTCALPIFARIVYAPYTRYFVREYLAQCQRSEPVWGTAFLSLGTEGIVSRMYETLRTGLILAGIPAGELEFFDIHIACDDEHAVTLENMMMSFAGQPGWFDACLGAMRSWCSRTIPGSRILGAIRGSLAKAFG